MSIIDKMKAMPGFISLKGASESRVDTAQQALETTFSPEYAAFLKEFGAVAVAGHELIGVCDFPRLDVVCVTQEERSLNPSIPKAWYVIEQTNMDDVVIWQAPSGEVYQSQPYHQPVFIAGSLADYLEF